MASLPIMWARRWSIFRALNRPSNDSINTERGHYPTSDALVLGGTQDNGTEQFRNSPVFYHSDEGDGGSTAVDPSQPTHMLSTYYGPSPKRSTQAGAFGSWRNAAGGLA